MKNIVPGELRRFINQRGRPLELLAAIADGRKVTAADPDDPGKKIRVYPALRERTSAAKTLLNKLVPDLKSTELSRSDGKPLFDRDPGSGHPDEDVELARRLAFLMASGQNAENDKTKSLPSPKPSLPPALPPVEPPYARCSSPTDDSAIETSQQPPEPPEDVLQPG